MGLNSLPGYCPAPLVDILMDTSELGDASHMNSSLDRIEAHPDKWGDAWNLLEEARDQIKELRKLLFQEAAMNLLNFQRHDEGETRSWDELPADEQNARIEVAERFLKCEHRELLE